jgi:hypothetical protein
MRSLLRVPVLPGEKGFFLARGFDWMTKLALKAVPPWREDAVRSPGESSFTQGGETRQVPLS